MLPVIVPRLTGCTKHFAGNYRNCPQKVSSCCTTTSDRIRLRLQAISNGVFDGMFWSIFLQPDLAPSDCPLFGPLRKHLAARCLTTEVQEAIVNFLRDLDLDFSHASFDRLVHR
ncbi:hypothetical protein AVEN_7569-1 [Araneus ventricosus]|uniref:Uncharacterized protein n=1 Tax=Araneus ventricosus TaxID=182803 RepID=A0A4Y2IR82_ARAVE|nr:hypothetical protein AVEN_7569-1 [Araneus ventricosus]